MARPALRSICLDLLPSKSGRAELGDGLALDWALSLALDFAEPNPSTIRAYDPLRVDIGFPLDGKAKPEPSVELGFGVIEMAGGQQIECVFEALQLSAYRADSSERCFLRRAARHEPARWQYRRGFHH